jgi:uncharacterized protein
LNLSTEFNTKLFLSNPHTQTLAGAFLRARNFNVPFLRTTLELYDSDFIDIDWLCATPRNKKLLLITTGLEGSSESSYAKYFAIQALIRNYDCAIWNFRGCSGRPNNQLKSYHSGYSDDLELVLTSDEVKQYSSISLLGVSVGGNITLKLLGERCVSSSVTGAVAISTPCDLKDAAQHLEKGIGRFYMHYFLKSLKNKLLLKAPFYSDLSKQDIKSVSTFIEFDDKFTAPFFGFKNALDYYEKSSCGQFLEEIKVTSLYICSKDDPFFTNLALPFKLSNTFVQTCITPRGGHAGFYGNNWISKKVFEFFDKV